MFNNGQLYSGKFSLQLFGRKKPLVGRRKPLLDDSLQVLDGSLQLFVMTPQLLGYKKLLLDEGLLWVIKKHGLQIRAIGFSFCCHCLSLSKVH